MVGKGSGGLRTGPWARAAQIGEAGIAVAAQRQTRYKLLIDLNIERQAVGGDAICHAQTDRGELGVAAPQTSVRVVTQVCWNVTRLGNGGGGGKQAADQRRGGERRQRDRDEHDELAGQVQGREASAIGRLDCDPATLAKKLRLLEIFAHVALGPATEGEHGGGRLKREHAGLPVATDTRGQAQIGGDGAVKRHATREAPAQVGGRGPQGQIRCDHRQSYSAAEPVIIR